MVNALTMPSSVHVAFTGVLVVIVIVIACFVFYTFRTSSVREQTFTDAMKVVRAATEIVATMAERGLPDMRKKLEDIDAKARTADRRSLQLAQMIEQLRGNVSSSAAVPTPPPATDEAAMIAARKAARLAQAA